MIDVWGFQMLLLTVTSWGDTRIQGALKNVGHCVGRSTIARILRAAGIPPVPDRPTSWQTFLRAHWGEIAAADFFTTEVWTWLEGRCSCDGLGGLRPSAREAGFDVETVR